MVVVRCERDVQYSSSVRTHTHAPLHACAGPPRAAPVCIMNRKWRLDVDARAARLSPPHIPTHTSIPMRLRSARLCWSSARLC